jgi:outer membrane protein assembly factor BamB
LPEYYTGQLNDLGGLGMHAGKSFLALILLVPIALADTKGLSEKGSNPEKAKAGQGASQQGANAPRSPDELWEAARKGDAKAVDALLAKGVDVNAKTPYGVTALYFAASQGHANVINVLVKHKADVNAKDTFYGVTPIFWAAYEGHAKAVEALLAGGASGADTGVLLAAMRGHPDAVRVFLDKGKLPPGALHAALAVTPDDQKAIIDMLKKAGAKQVTLPKLGLFGGSKVADYAGAYKSVDATEVTVAVQSGKLTVKTAGGPALALKAVNDTTFQVVGNDATTFAFKRDGDKVKEVTMKRGTVATVFSRQEEKKAAIVRKAVVPEKPVRVEVPQNWPSFRGPGASGVADGQNPPTAWDVDKGIHVRWKTPIPGLGHSAPIVWGDRVFVTTAVSGDPKLEFRVGLFGDVDSAKDKSVHSWRVYCLDKATGQIIWERTACQGVPKVRRHIKASHANSTPATDGTHLVVCFGSEGLYCYSLSGSLLWRRDLGLLDSGWFINPEYQWGFGSSPIIYRDRVIVQCDIGKNSFIAAYDIETGKPIWQTPRDEVPSWGTPTLVASGGREPPVAGHVSNVPPPEIIANGTKFIRGYDPQTGKELWRLGKNSEVTVPTPIYGQGLVFVTSGYRPIQPIYAIRPGATGDITLKKGTESNAHVAWSTPRGGPYMQTPLVYGPHLYTCSDMGVVTCYDAKTGKQIYRKPLGGASYTASGVAADGRLYFTSEQGEVYVVKAGPKFELLAMNPLNDSCMATPAIADGMFFARTQHYVFGIGRQEIAKK